MPVQVLTNLFYSVEKARVTNIVLIYASSETRGIDM